MFIFNISIPGDIPPVDKKVQASKIEGTGVGPSGVALGASIASAVLTPVISKAISKFVGLISLQGQTRRSKLSESEKIEVKTTKNETVAKEGFNIVSARGETGLRDITGTGA